MSYLLLFWLFLKASLFSTGGTGNLPILYPDLTRRRWAMPAQFAEALAVGQVSPGPNGLWVTCLGYLIGGMRGALLALAAITIPPLVVLAIERLYSRLEGRPSVPLFARGLSLAVVGIFSVILWRLLQSAHAGGWGLTISAAAAVLASTRRIPIVAILLLFAAVGLLRPSHRGAGTASMSFRTSAASPTRAWTSRGMPCGPRHSAAHGTALRMAETTSTKSSIAAANRSSLAPRSSSAIAISLRPM